MAKASPAEIKELMKATGVGMMECKKAIEEADGDKEKAITLLREKGLATQAKKSGRAAAEGIVTAIVDGNVAAVAKTIIETNPADVEDLKTKTISGGTSTVGEVLTELAGMKIRENIVIRRFERREGVLASYIHNGGSIGVLVRMETNLSADQVAEVGKNVAMQSAAMNASYLNREAVPAEVLENEKTIIMAQMAEDPKMASKSEQVRAKIAEGKVGKYYSENCLLEQTFVRSDLFEGTVAKYVADAAKKLGGTIEVVECIRYERGEGVEKKADDFAAEVAAMAKGN